MLVAISYDNPAILKDFADRHKIEYPLLADPESKIIASYGVLNPEATGMRKGMALPGYYYADGNGIIREQYFETNYTDRFTANNVLTKLFPELAEEVSQKVAAPHLGLELSQSDRAVAPGNRFHLSVQAELPQDVHVYAPGVKGYKPIQLELRPSPEVQLMPPTYPASRILYLEAIKEEVPVFEGKFRITSDAKISADPEFIKSLGPQGKTVIISGQLSYQACDKTICYLPTSIPVSWQLTILPLDRQRSPEAIQHREMQERRIRGEEREEERNPAQGFRRRSKQLHLMWVETVERSRRYPMAAAEFAWSWLSSLAATNAISGAVLLEASFGDDKAASSR